MEKKLQQLKQHLARVVDLERAADVLGWDQETNMPNGGAAARADQVSTLRGLAHQYFVSDEVGKLLEGLSKHQDELDYDSDEAGLIRVTLREYQRLVKVPGQLIEEIAHASSLGLESWREARAKADFSLFEPILSKLVDLRLQWAECFKPYDNIYDPLLDFYEPGITHQYIEGVFSELKPHLIELVQAIVKNGGLVDDSVLRRSVDQERQLAFGREVAVQIGYDFDRGRLDLSSHPFTIHFTRDDVRITTRVDEHDLSESLMGIIHESGHAMYEQNTSPTLYRTRLDQGASMAVHESQSRFYENNIGRSRPFWKHFFPKLQAATKPVFDDVDLEAFYRAINKSEPSLIRTEADEVTYGLHIMLRFELENAIVNGKVKVSDLPKEWNDRMEAYLGVVPPSDREGVLQDIHWSQGYIGYFPDYLLGSIFAVQLWEQMLKDQPNTVAEIEAGQFDNILSWQREHIHQHGFKFTLPELAERVTGGPLKWQPYMNYLKTKYGEIYQL